MNERIKKLRKHFGLTQQEFANKLGISRNNIATYEANKSKPGEAVISLMCKTFQVNEEWLRTGKNEMFPEETKSVLDEVSEKLNLNAFETAFLKVYMRLPKQQRDNFCNGLYDEFFKLSQTDTVSKESRWEQEARLLQEEADAVKKDGEKCSASPRTKEA